MAKLFVYDASGVNRDRNDDYSTLLRNRNAPHPVIEGFRRALKQLNPPVPFLLRGLFGERGYRNGRIIVRNIFEGGKSLEYLLSTILKNGHDKDEAQGHGLVHPNEQKLKLRKHVDYSSMLWADEYRRLEDAHPYRFFDDSGCHPQGFVNDFTMIIDPRFYINGDSRILFYQPDIALRRKALLGIIISDTNPHRPELKPLRFTLNTRNLRRVIRTLQEHGYFS